MTQPSAPISTVPQFNFSSLSDSTSSPLLSGLELLIILGIALGIYRLGRQWLHWLSPHLKSQPLRYMSLCWSALCLLSTAGVTTYILGLTQVPLLYPLGQDIVSGLHQIAGQALLVIGLAYIAWHLVSVVSSRIVLPEQFDRRTVRITTLKGVIDSTLRVVIVIMALAALLQLAGISPMSLLAGVSVMSVAVGFGAQTLVQDIFNGFFILLEGQYGVGDDITINGNTLSGTVEGLSLRITTLRSGDGAVHIIPNSQISTVTVTTRGWAGVSASVEISHHADADAALKVLAAVGSAMYTDTAWKPLLLEMPQVQGVTRLGLDSVKVQTFFKVVPKHQDDIAMEFNRRIKPALEQAGMALAEPSRRVVMVGNGTAH